MSASRRGAHAQRARRGAAPAHRQPFARMRAAVWWAGGVLAADLGRIDVDPQRCRLVAAPTRVAQAVVVNDTKSQVRVVSWYRRFFRPTDPRKRQAAQAICVFIWEMWI